MNDKAVCNKQFHQSLGRILLREKENKNTGISVRKARVLPKSAQITHF